MNAAVIDMISMHWFTEQFCAAARRSIRSVFCCAVIMGIALQRQICTIQA